MRQSRILFDKIREQALKAGVKDNRVAIGKWAKENGYIKKESADKDGYYVYYLKIGEF